ncbi:endothelin-converting enzyme homolog isoform X2 [Tribolium madens]|uniref:endothelin-converting enzyme homolog isoform X2 n=1 Tax=Tribolium madens TaxID=41895 RepID=UPI001CF73D04|nr:endothelin-converting enzyme homolog isoform X2 [Tribolium madens]
MPCNFAEFFRSKPKFFKILSAVLIAIIIILLIVIIILVVQYYKKTYLNICTSEECLKSAANLKLSIDSTTNPCDDFYQYTCGRWSKEHPNHGWFSSFSTFATVSEKVLLSTEEFLTSNEVSNEPSPITQARNFYKSCIDEESLDDLGLSVIYKYLKEADLPSVPSLVTKTDEEIAEFQFDWLKSDAVIKKTFAMDVLIGFVVDSNIFNQSENVMYIGVPGLRCPLPSPFKKNDKKTGEENSPNLEELRRLTNGNIIKFVLSTIYRDVLSKELNEDVLEQASDVLLNMTFEIDTLVANFSIEVNDLQSQKIKELQAKINKILLNNVNKEYPQILEKYLDNLFTGTNVTIDFDKDLLFVGQNDVDYLPKILSYVLSTSDIYLELYMWWVTVFAMIINTSSEIVEYIVKQTAPFYTGTAVLRSRSLDCSALVTSFMGMAISYGLVDQTFSNKTKPKVEQMLYDIKSAFVEHVKTLSWMDKETKTATLEKSKDMLSFIGYPDWLLEKGALETYYQGIVLANNTYLDNMMSFTKLYVPSRLEELRKINERNWSTDPLSVNAFNSFTNNAINLPMAILAFPIYHLGLEVLNYGAMGSILGHELTHGFDNEGRKHDRFGNYKEWWSHETIHTFEEKIECFVKQYDNFTVDGVESHVQGKKTLGENIADNGGLRHAYWAYRKYVHRNGLEPKLPGFENFTNDQLFFIAFGSIWCETISPDDLENQIEYDEHSPNKIRVIGSLQNSEEFAQAFQCPVGSKMNPNTNKCQVW